MRACICVIGIVLASAFPAASQSLAVAAKQEAARREAVKSATKTYTNSDLKRFGTETTPSSASAAADPNGGSPPPDGATPESPKTRRTPSEEMQERAEKLFGPRLTEINSEFRTNDKQYRSLVAQVQRACTGTTQGTTASEGSVFLGYDPLLSVSANGDVSVIPNPQFLPTTSAGTVSIDNSSTPLCQSLRAQMQELVGWARMMMREIEEMEVTAHREGIYPGVLRSLVAAKLND